MPVHIGNSYVSEAAYSFAVAQTNEETGKGDVLKGLKEKFGQLKFNIGAGPFSGSGTNNVSISPKILQAMAQDPEKRQEYEALIYDVAHTDLAHGRQLQSAGFIIDDDGGLRAWSVSKHDDGQRRSQSFAKRTKEKNWWQKILDAPKKAKAKKKDKQKEEAAKVEISAKAQEKLRLDAQGEMTTESAKSTVTINEAKSRRQIAAASTQDDMRMVLAHLEQDLQEVEDGLKKNMCDEAEVEKAKKLIEEAKERMGKLPNRQATPEEQSMMAISMLI
ncbi:MAG: hypothetical protein IJ849_04355 [Selenomonadaceae bacterium]|nr:hypothetical protein [Selenomonadaceae bacterium]